MKEESGGGGGGGGGGEGRRNQRRGRGGRNKYFQHVRRERTDEKKNRKIKIHVSFRLSFYVIWGFLVTNVFLVCF